ncbi:serine/threonine protein kinase [Ciceribacter sp. L1K23]|uniref:serine/threonine-protein kinase n=1 Tax=Ciceribacter sp. L1K23 TaxID=2820276 RepID=UPI001B822B72|nr:serine/threonine-protein kinase [Ciceribacter sp. L1K23]MBR0558419.1 serine/threonine protein kinase [Ciceribacter sp. L1K23]
MPRTLRGRFELVEEIGRGGLSRVYRARDLVAVKAGLSQTSVAVKVMTAGPEVGDDIISLMHREARRLRDLIHPNIVRVYDIDSEGRLHFMVMEYLEGRSLAKVLRETEGHRLHPPQVDRLVRDVAAALHFSHHSGIVHSDLKPANIFIETNGRVKLIDFNIAYPVARPIKISEEDTVAILARLGALTPAYASPQRLQGAEPSSGDDVFSLGLVAFLALTGRRPFESKDASEAIAANEMIKRPEGLSWWRWQALSAALKLDDAKRLSDAQLFARLFTGGPWAQTTWRLGLR